MPFHDIYIAATPPPDVMPLTRYVIRGVMRSVRAEAQRRDMRDECAARRAAAGLCGELTLD